MEGYIMNRMNTVLFVLITALCFAAASAIAEDTTANELPRISTNQGEQTRSAPVLMIDFEDTIAMHNMGIASDGTFYYTCNGGTASVGQINKYDLGGVFVSSVPCPIDMRAIFYNPADGKLYAKVYGSDLYEIDPVTGSATLILSGIFQQSQSSPAISPDGLYLLEHHNGNVYFIDFVTGALINTLSGFSTGGAPYYYAVGTDGDRIFTWDASMVYVYDMGGAFIESYNLPSGNYGYSLKYVNGLLFASVDGSGGTGHWYGYDVGQVAIEQSSWGSIKGLFQ
jgi:hypothetical protein